MRTASSHTGAFLVALILCLDSSPAAALAFTPVPEPGTLGLLAAGAVAAVVVWVRNRRK